MTQRFVLGCFLIFTAMSTGCSDDEGQPGTAGAGGEGAAGGMAGTGGSGGSGDTGGTGGDFEPPAFGEWLKFEPEGTVCSDGSQYAFYVEFSETSDNLVIFMMGGGGCWDYDSCISGNARGATNPNGLPDNYANEHLFFPLGETSLPINVNEVYPLLNDDPAVSPMADWNKVFVPYCTGDVYSGSITNTYEDPDGLLPDADFAHQGHTNVVAMTEMLDEMFSSVPRFFVGGCSAGGAGAIVNYYFLRTGISGVEQGYLLNDSGPIFLDQRPTSRSLPLHQEVRTVWDADSLIDKAPQSEALSVDFGELSRVLSEEFPNDRLATTFFRLDYNFSLYSYERFWTRDEDSIVLFDGEGLGLDEDVAADRTAIHTLWWDDIDLLRDQYDASGRDNLAYFIPFYRTTNSSHCVTVPGFEDVPEDQLVNLFFNDFATLAWAGSEIESEGLNLRDYVDHLLSDDPLQSFFEEDGEGPFAVCAPGPEFDEVACETAVGN